MSICELLEAKSKVLDTRSRLINATIGKRRQGKVISKVSKRTTKQTVRLNKQLCADTVSKSRFERLYHSIMMD